MDFLQELFGITTIIVSGFPLIAVVLGLVEFSKKLGLEGKPLLVVSMVLGLLFGIGYQVTVVGQPATAGEWFSAAIVGLVFGLVASGVYDLAKEDDEDSLMDTDLIFEKSDLLRANEALTQLQAENFIRPELAGFGSSVVDLAKVYPPEHGPLSYFRPIGKRRAYRRTGTLGRLWASFVAGLNVRMQNAAGYSDFVMGQKQPYAYKAGWKRLKQVAMDRMDLWVLETESKAWKLWERP